jgi:hypothetical protein
LLLSIVILAAQAAPAQVPRPAAGPLTITFNPTSVPAGTSATGTITISEPAPEGGLAVSLSSNTPAAIVPRRVVVPSGASEATFTVGAKWVTAPTPVRIAGTAVGRLYVAGTGTLTLLPSGVAFLLFDPPNVVGGSPSIGTVLLTAPAPEGGIVVQLSVPDPSSPSPASPCSPPPTVPATVRVPGGSSRATFPIATSPSWREGFEIRATYGATSATGVLRVTKPWLKDVKLPPRVTAGSTIQGVVQLAGPALPPNCGIKHRLASSDPDVVEVPADIVIPAGASEVTFVMKTSKVPTPQGITITATGFYFYTDDAYSETKQTRIALTPW